MRVGIMQPYFVPYIGYWQLMNAVDKYVIYDDVNFIKGGWINRNRILNIEGIQYFNIPMVGASSNKKINEILTNYDERSIKKNLNTIEFVYKRAPFFEEIFQLVKKILQFNANNLALFNANAIKLIADYLEINTEFILSSGLDKDNSLQGQDKVIAICKLLGADEYYNAIGGKSMYSTSEFKKNGIELKFLNCKNIEYSQFGNQFYSNLSIIDVMMFNDKSTVKMFLGQYDLS